VIQFTLPIYWIKEYKTKTNKKVLVGMNWYRNAHYFDQNKFKKEFEAKIAEQLKDSIEAISGSFTMEYNLYYKNPNSDPSNIIALIEKVSLDALQDLNIIKNDNVMNHKGSEWKVVDKDVDEPRVEIIIKEIK